MKTNFVKWALVGTFVFALSPNLFADAYEDAPRPDEIFSSFFARLTHGGFFPGIRLEAPQKVQDSFLKKIKRGYWVGARNQVYKSLEKNGVNLWGDWFKSVKTNELIFSTSESKSLIMKAIQEVLNENSAQCSPSCPLAKEIFDKEWSQQNSFSHEVFVKAYVLRAPLFKAKTIAEFLAKRYQMNVLEALETTKIQLLKSADFKAAVHEVGYGGEIYFRGITTVDPKDAKRHIILLDDEALGKASPFDYPLYKQLEIAAILTHELSHVMQDLRGNTLGLDVQVTSAETALVIEGMAEYWAESALSEAGDSVNYPSALKLFVVEQAVEIVYRPGNESSGNLFPYTVGMPFISALYDLTHDNEKLTDRLLGVLSGKEELRALLKQLP